jgi:hypothetical protein
MTNQRLRATVTVVGTAIVIFTIVTGFVVLGSPGVERRRLLDERRTNDLRDISRAVNVYRTRNGTLPRTLEEPASAVGQAAGWRDPRTGAPYAYRVLDEQAFELCADFETDQSEGPGFWAHAAGRHCFKVPSSDVKP